MSPELPLSDTAGDHLSSQFVQTRWSVVLDAKSGSYESLDLLCQWYREPLRRHIRRRGFKEQDADDLIQEFLGRKLVEGAIFKSVVDPRAVGGNRRFRTFLLTCLDFFLRDKWRRRPDPADAHAGVSIDAETEDGRRSLDLEAPPMTPADEAAARADWAEAVLQLAEDKHRIEYLDAGKSVAGFKALNAYYNNLPEAQSGADVARLLGITENAFYVTKHRFAARRTYWLREVVKETLENPNDWESEVRELLEGDV